MGRTREIFWWMQLHPLLSLCNMHWVSNSKKWTQHLHNTRKKLRQLPSHRLNLLTSGGIIRVVGGGDREKRSTWFCHYHFQYLFFFFLTGCAVWVKAPSQKWEKLLSKVQPLSSWNLENGHWRGRSKLGTKDGGGTLATAVVVRGFTGAPFIKNQLVVSGSWVRAEEKPGRLRRGNDGLCLHPKKVKRIYMCEESCFEHPQ